MKYAKSMPGEAEARWQGKPDLSLMPEGKITRSDLLMLILVGTVMVYLGVTIGPTLAGSFAGMALWAAIIAVLAAMLWFFKGGRARLARIRLARSTYALGPRSMFIHIERPGKAPRVLEFLITDKNRIAYDGNEPGTVVMFETSVDHSTPRTGYYSRFALIHGAAQVYALMLEMQKESAARQAAKR